MDFKDRERFNNYQNAEDFILDKNFVHWVLKPSDELDLYWSLFINEHPEKEGNIRDAILIIKSIQPTTLEVSQEKIDAIFRRIKASEEKLKVNWNSFLKYAAVISIFVAIGSLIYTSVYNHNKFPIEAANKMDFKGKVILADGSTKEFDSEQTPIKQTASGDLIINSDTIDVKIKQSSTSLNRIIIPYGKRSDIMLADGTHIWLNSGSQLSYPNEFKSDSREVFLSGEALFEVKANPEKPFYVITKDIKIKVLGTIFNVSSYAEDSTVQTVLLKGKVTAGRNKLFASTINLAPGELLTYNKNNSNLSKEKVDVNLYSSWVNGYLVFVNVPITEVFMKLERYYNQDIKVEDSLGQITFSGKLDLKENLKDVLDDIVFASSVNVQKNDGFYIIKK
ncbi:MAG: FecR family protein [Paludibacter sp.]